MKPQPDPRALLQKEFLAQLPSLWPPLKGSLAFVKKPCIRKKCPACARGGQTPGLDLSPSPKTAAAVACRVPKDLVALLRQGLQNGRLLEQLLFALGPALLRAHRPARPKPA